MSSFANRPAQGAGYPFTPQQSSSTSERLGRRLVPIAMLALAACNMEQADFAGELAPSLDVNAVPAVLPDDSTLAGGAAVVTPRLRELFNARARGTSLDPTVTAAIESARSLHIGCGGTGCAVVVGDDGIDRAALAEASGLTVAGDGGNLVIGDAEAVRAALLRADSNEAPAPGGLLPSSLEGAIPAGEIWWVVWDLDRTRLKARARLEAEGTVRTARLARALGSVESLFSSAVPGVEVVASSLTLGEPAITRYRITCENAEAALRMALRTRRALGAAARLVPETRIRSTLLGARVVTSDRYVEVTLEMAEADLFELVSSERFR